ATTTYTFTPTAGQCATTATLTIIVNSNVTPTFNLVAAICSGTTLSPLPTTSTNGINGSWLPALNNTATTTYTFTPTAGQCASTATLTVTVNPLLTSTQTQAVCTNQLPYTWYGHVFNAAGSLTDTVASTTGGCDTLRTLTLTVNSNVTPTFAQIGPLCQNSIAPLFPGTSNNGIAGTWSPAMISTLTPGTNNYTFTPTGGCA